jgi:hypothetical protein
MQMTYRIMMSSALALGCVIALQAQAPTSTETNRTIPGEITVTGCVERADQMSATGTAGTTVDSLSFVLIHAARGTAADLRVAGTSGTEADMKGSTYRLDADISKLNPHVGHKVEVTGTLDAAATTTAGSTDPSSAGNAPKLKVDVVKMMSETCAR